MTGKLGRFARHVALGALLFAAGASAQTGDADSAPVFEPEARDALDRMGRTLQAMSDFTLHGDVTNELVLDSGQKLQFGGTIRIEAHRPTGLKITVDSDAATREIFYDGATLTIFAPRLKYYASVPAPRSIGLMLDEAKTQYGLEIPVADLFTWGTDQTLRARIVSGYVIRPEKIGPRTCMHYAFRQEKVDWQIWLDESAGNLPCKLVITSRQDPEMPQYSVLFTWQSMAPVPASTFAFRPSGDARRITLAQLDDDDASGDAQ